MQYLQSRFKTIFLLILASSATANNNISISPKIDLSLFYDESSKDYNNLGRFIYKKESLSTTANVIGGEIGGVVKNNELEFVLQGSGIFSLQNLPDNEKINATYFNNDKNEFFYLSNVYLSKDFENINFKIGRQKYNNEVVNLNKRATTNQYEGVYFDYKNDLFKINSLYFNKVSSSTVSNVVPFNHNFGVLGYGKGYQIGDFISVSQHISNKDYDTNGALVSDITFGDSKNNINIQNLYIDDYFNTFDIASKATFEYGDFKIIPKIGYIKQFDVGENLLQYDFGNKKIDANMYQTSLKVKYKNIFTTFNYANSSNDENSILNGTLISPFSNKLGWIVGPQTAHSFIANTISKELLTGVNFDIFSKKSIFLISFIDYNIANNNGLINQSLNTKEKYIYMDTTLNKNFNLSVHYSIAENFDQVTEESKNFRVLLNYNF